MNPDQPARAATTTRAERLVGKTFLHPVFDYLLIGGVFSLILTAIISVTGRLSIGSITLGDWDISLMAPLVLLTTSVHFSSSTVRLYMKPGAYQELPFLTLVFPLVTFAILTLCVLEAGTLGPNLMSLQMTWSPYHYAAQAYGLAVMYCFHSGCALSARNKRLLLWTCMLPVFNAVCQPGDAGLGWVLPASVLSEPAVFNTLIVARSLLSVLIFAAPLLLFVVVWRSASGPMPIISLLVVLTNGVWWAALVYRDAFVWATVFHGIQYIAIVTIFHVKDQLSLGGSRSGLSHTLRFYGLCVLLAYGLFHLLPHAYVFAGFGFVESMLMVVSIVNLHHFIVDGYIWRLGRGSNRKIVQEDAGALA